MYGSKGMPDSKKRASLKLFASSVSFKPLSLSWLDQSTWQMLGVELIPPLSSVHVATTFLLTQDVSVSRVYWDELSDHPEVWNSCDHTAAEMIFGQILILLFQKIIWDTFQKYQAEKVRSFSHPETRFEGPRMMWFNSQCLKPWL